MFWFILGVILLLIGAVIFSKRKTFAGDPESRDYDGTRRAIATVGALLFLIGLSTIVWDSFTIVPARNVGVVNTFGRADRTLDNGFHWVSPWSSVETIDATIQTVKLDAGVTDDQGDCITVRLANQTTACVDTTIQWHIDQEADANSLWAKYRGQNDAVVANIQTNVVLRELQKSANDAFGSYNPLSVLNGGQAPSETTTTLAAKVLDSVKSHVDAGIDVDSLLFSIVHYDATTQNKLNTYAQALADTQIAQQQVATAQQQKLANDTLAADKATADPGVMYQNCLNLVKQLAAADQLKNLPAGFQLCPATGNTPAVIVNGSK